MIARKNWFCFLAAVIGQFCFAQLGAYKSPKFNIRPVSTDILSIISNQLSLDKQAQSMRRAQKALGVDLLKDKLFSEQLVTQFNLSYNATLNEIKQYDYLAGIPNYVEKIGLKDLQGSAYNDLPQSVNGFLPSILRHNSTTIFKLYMLDVVETHASDFKKQIKTLALLRMQLIKSIDDQTLDKIDDIRIFTEKFCKDYSGIDSLIRVNINFKSVQINALISQAAFESRKQYASLVVIANTAITTEVKKLDTEIGKLKADIEKEATAALDKVGESFKRLSENQKALDVILTQGKDNLNGYVNNLGNSLKKKTKEIEDFVQKNANASSTEVENKLKQLDAEYKVLRQKLDMATTLVSNLTTGRFNLKQGYDFLKDAVVKQVFGEDLKKIKDSFNSIVTAGEVTLKNVETLSNVGYTLANNLVLVGVLSRSDAKKVSAFIKYTSAAVKIGVAVGKLFVNPVAAIGDLIGGISSLFGGDSKSVEEQKLEEISQKIDQVLEELGEVKKNLVTISKQITDLHVQMNESFNQVFYMLGYIDFKLSNIQEMARLQLYGEFNTCDNFLDDSTLTPEKSTWDDYNEMFTTETGICLNGLNKFSITKDEGFFYLAVSREQQDEKDVDRQILKVYNPVFRLFTALHDKPDKPMVINNALNALMLPVNSTSDLNLPLFYANQSPSILDFAKIGNFFNSALISKYVFMFNKLSPYFEMNLDEADFKPADLDDYLGSQSEKGWTSKQRALKNGFQRNRVRKMLNVTNKAIIQQNLLAGGIIINDIIGLIENSASNIIGTICLIDSALVSNRYLATNLATKLLAVEFNVKPNDTINSYDKSIVPQFLRLRQVVENTRILNAEKDEPATNLKYIDSLSRCKFLTLFIDSAIKANDQHLISFNFIFDESILDNKLEVVPMGYLNPKTGEQLKIKLDIPFSDLILKDQMVYPDELYNLLSAKNILKNKLFALTFNEKLPKYDAIKSGVAKADRETFKLIYKFNPK